MKTAPIKSPSLEIKSSYCWKPTCKLTQAYILCIMHGEFKHSMCFLVAALELHWKTVYNVNCCTFNYKLHCHHLLVFFFIFVGFDSYIYYICDITRQGFRVTSGLIFWYSLPRRHVIYVMLHFLIKRSELKWNTLLVYSLFRFIIPLLCLLCLATATLDLETNLIGMQNKYTRGWYDIAVSGG